MICNLNSQSWHKKESFRPVYSNDRKHIAPLFSLDDVYCVQRYGKKMKQQQKKHKGNRGGKKYLSSSMNLGSTDLQKP